MWKILTMGASSLIGLATAALLPPPDPEGPGGPPPPPKKKEAGPEGDLRKAYDLLRRIRADSRPTGRPEERLRDWTERATKLYREGLGALEAGDPRLAHEYGVASHDLARAVDHTRNAALYDGPDAELPAPPAGPGPEGRNERVSFDLRRAYDRIREGLYDDEGAESKFYLDAARDLYNSARRDAVAGREERAGELARAAEAMTHVPEHLAHAKDDHPEPPKRKGEHPKPKHKPKRKGEGPEAKRPPAPPEPADPKADRGADDLPPPL